MGYSTSRLTVERRWHLVEPLAEGRECRWRVPPGTESISAYRIREALHAASHHPDIFPSLSKAKDLYEIKIERTGLVVARLRRTRTEIELVMGPLDMEDSPEMDAPETPRMSVDSVPIRQTGKQHALSVAEAWRKAQPFKGKLHFPEADLDQKQLTKVYKWATREELMMFVSDRSLTLVPHDPELEEAAWEPEDD